MGNLIASNLSGACPLDGTNKRLKFYLDVGVKGFNVIGSSD